MSSTTTNLGLPYPQLGDVADIESFGVKPLADAIDSDLIHVGDLKATARSTSPTGWLLCDGSAVSRTTYAKLFAAISVAYGAGNGTTTFNIPDLRGRVPVGVDGAANRLTASDALGQVGGAEKVTLSIGEMPSHAHNPPTGGGSGYVIDGGGAEGSGQVSGPAPYNLGSTPNVGGGGAHNNMQPYQVVNWLIKT